jgi:hypothetical protein
MAEPLRSGEGTVIVDLDFTLIDRRKMLMDSAGPPRTSQSHDRPFPDRARSRTRSAPGVGQ